MEKKPTKLSSQLNRLRDRYSRAVKFESMLSGVRFYRFDWSDYVPKEDFDEESNPSFTKAAADVHRARGFWRGLYKSLIGDSINEEANDYCLFDVISKSGEELQSVIQFVSMTKKQMDILEGLASKVLEDDFIVVPVNGDKVKGKDSERYIKDQLIKAKSEGKQVWVIASQMCQRSFSIPEINCVLLSYDNGDKGATQQKMSRALTSGSNKTLGHIVSLSIDSNRDEKISTIVMETAKKDAEKEGKDILESVKKVLRTLPIFQMVSGEVKPINVDSYAKEVFSSSNSHRLVVDREKLLSFSVDDESFSILTGLNLSELDKGKMVAAFKKGQTFKKNGDPQIRARGESEKTLIELMKNNLIRLSDRLQFCIKMVKDYNESLTLQQFYTTLDKSQNLQKTLEVSPKTLSTLIREGYICENLLSLLVRS